MSQQTKKLLVFSILLTLLGLVTSGMLLVFPNIIIQLLNFGVGLNANWLALTDPTDIFWRVNFASLILIQCALAITLAVEQKRGIFFVLTLAFLLPAFIRLVVFVKDPTTGVTLLVASFEIVAWILISYLFTRTQIIGIPKVSPNPVKSTPKV